MTWVSGRYKTYAEKSPLDPADLNAIQDSYLRSAGLKADDFTADLGLQDYGGLTGSYYRRQAEVDDTEYSSTVSYYDTITNTSSITTSTMVAGTTTDRHLEIYYSAMLKVPAGSTVDCAMFLNNAPPIVQSITGGSKYVEKTGLTTAGVYVVNTFPPEAVANSNQAWVSSSTVANTEPCLLPGPMIHRIEAPGGGYRVYVAYKLTSGAGPYYVKNKRLLVSLKKLGA